MPSKETGIVGENRLSVRAKVGLGFAIGSLTALAACSSTDSGPAPVVAETSIGAEQGGTSTGETGETSTTTTFEDHKQLFAQNGEQATFDAIFQAIEFSKQGDIAASVQILTNLGLTQEMVDTALVLEGQTATNAVFLKSYEAREDQPYTLTTTITNALSPDVLGGLPLSAEDNNNTQGSYMLEMYFNLVPSEKIDETTRLNIDNAHTVLINVAANNESTQAQYRFTQEEKKAWNELANAAIDSNNTVRSQQNLKTYRSQ